MYTRVNWKSVFKIVDSLCAIECLFYLSDVMTSVYNSDCTIASLNILLTTSICRTVILIYDID